jgi:hypothetical protein
MSAHLGVEAVAAPAATAEPQAAGRKAAAMAAIHRQLRELKRAVARASNIDNDLYPAMAILIDYARGMVAKRQYEDAYNLVLGVELAAVHAKEPRVARMARATLRTIAWAKARMGGSV